jgi:putative addiction module component (TIGR02574 family)
VTTAAQKVLEDALALPKEERAVVMEALADSLVGIDQAEIDEAWRAEILRRVEQVRSGEVTLESWEDVRRAGREALARR